jgi:hypothetical protein
VTSDLGHARRLGIPGDFSGTSAMPPIATELVLRNEPSRCAQADIQPKAELDRSDARIDTFASCR